MLNKNHKRQNGFTIIEIMIVLAIAGLIMLIVFLAVPALERSARNTQRKNDVSAIASSVANYIDNNGGTLPTNVGGAGSSLTICGNAGCTGNTETATLGYYTAADVSISAAAGNANPAAQGQNSVYLDLGYSCNAAGTAIAGSGGARTVAILYGIETSSTALDQQCEEQ